MNTRKKEHRSFDPKDRFEFVLKKNGNIICGRVMNRVNIPGNKIVKIDPKPLMDNLTSLSLNSFGAMGIIPSYLKKGSVDKLWNSFNPYAEPQQPEDITKDDIYAVKDEIQFELKYDTKTLAISQFPGNMFQTSIDIRDIIPFIFNEIRGYYEDKDNWDPTDYTRTYSTYLKKYVDRFERM